MVSTVSERAFQGISKFLETNFAKMEVVNGAQKEKGCQGRREGRSEGSAGGRQGRRQGRMEGRQGPGEAHPPGNELAGAEEGPVSQVRVLSPARARHRGRDRAFQERRN